MKKKILLLIFACTILFGIASAQGIPPNPEEFYGSLTLNGTPAPAGTYVVALINGTDHGNLTTTTAGFYGWDGQGTGPGSFETKLVVRVTEEEFQVNTHPTISFTVNGIASEQTAAFQSRGLVRLNLTAGEEEPVAPVANFSANRTSGPEPLAVKFTDLSTGTPPLTWLWDFGDDGTSTEQNPVHVYIDEGLYTVSLTVTNEAGSDTEIKTGYINVTEEAVPPVADFTAEPRNGTIPLTVHFTDLSTGTPPLTWLWDFGDDGTSTEQNPVHVYSAEGMYTVSLTVTNEAGSDTETKTDYINATEEIIPPVADFTAEPRNGTEPLTVEFTDLSTGTPPLTWFWDFGDDETSDEQNPVHVYAAEGLYTVSLTVTNEAGSDTETKTDYINVTEEAIPPVADFSAEPRNGTAPLTVEFTDLSTGTPPLTWLWDFGDDTNSTEQDPVHIYAAEGLYTVSLTVTNEAGSDTEIKTDYINVTEEIIPPDADFTAEPRNGTAPLAVEFTDLSTGTPPLTWLWDFGDDGTSTEENPVHVYTSEGLYTVSLTVTNEAGSDTETKTDYINVTGEIIPPDADFTANVTQGSKPLTVAFTDESTGTMPLTYLWSFGDGTTSTLKNPVHTYTNSATYSVSLTVTNEAGSDTETKTDYIKVTNKGLLAMFTGEPLSGVAPLLVQFTDLSSGNPIYRRWSFGDTPFFSTVTNPVHTYTKSGTFNVTLWVMNFDGTSTATKTDYVTVTAKPKAAFSADTSFGLPPLTVHFTDLSTESPTTWAWDFGDGTTSNVKNPVHVYDDPGSYTVKLTVSNSAGSSSVTKTDYVVVPLFR
ncbi:MAG: PKD domain-containing protein [Methanoregulaceae archaeon]|nr:PKD domain-containing protein [Methanoregulaceae archaeon]